MSEDEVKKREKEKEKKKRKKNQNGSLSSVKKFDWRTKERKGAKIY